MAEDVRTIVVAAERSEVGRPDGVTNAEAREIQLFVARNAKKLAPSAMHIVDAFMLRHNLPYEGNRVRMKERMLAALGRVGELGQALPRAPRTGSLQPVRLSSKHEPPRDAYYDVVKRQFVVKVAGKFYGPFPLPPI